MLPELEKHIKDKLYACAPLMEAISDEHLILLEAILSVNYYATRNVVTAAQHAHAVGQGLLMMVQLPMMNRGLLKKTEEKK